MSPMRVEFNMNRELLIRLFFFAAFALIVHQLVLLARPFLPGLLAAAMLAIALNPLSQQVRKYIRQPGWAALIMSLGSFLLAVLPLIWLGQTLLHESERLVPTV